MSKFIAAEVWYALKADTFRQYGAFTIRSLFVGAITKRTFRVIVSMRLCQFVSGYGGVARLLLPFFKALHRWTTSSAGVDLPWNAPIGAGFAMTHGWGCVVAPNTKIGSNVTIFHGATLGRRDRIGELGERITEYPVIENEVWIGPHAIVVGGVTVGRGSRIGGGAFVSEDVPPFSVVIGNPAQIVKSDCSVDVMNQAPDQVVFGGQCK